MILQALTVNSSFGLTRLSAHLFNSGGFARIHLIPSSRTTAWITMQIPILLDHFILRDYYHVLTCHIFASSHLFLLILVFFTWVKLGLLLTISESQNQAIVPPPSTKPINLGFCF